MEDKNIKIIPYVSKEATEEKKNPDALIGTTFKLGLGENEQKNKKKLVLPYYKDK